MGPAFVYRCFDAAGELLYVGCAQNVAQRMAGHRYKSPWAAHVDRVESHEYPERWQAEAVEDFLIDLLRPAHNKRVPGITGAYRLRQKYRKAA